MPDVSKTPGSPSNGPLKLELGFHGKYSAPVTVKVSEFDDDCFEFEKDGAVNVQHLDRKSLSPDVSPSIVTSGFVPSHHFRISRLQCHVSSVVGGV